MKQTIKECTVVINDPGNKFTENKAKSGGKVTYCPEKNTVTVEFSKPSEPADITTLSGGDSPTGIKGKRNNRSGVYSIVFNMTGAAIMEYGKKRIQSEVKGAVMAIFNDIQGEA